MKLKTYGLGVIVLQNPAQQRRIPAPFSTQNIVFLAKFCDNLGVNVLLRTLLSWVFLSVLEKWVRARKSIIMIVKATTFPQGSEVCKEVTGNGIHSSLAAYPVLSRVYCALFTIFSLLWIGSETIWQEATLGLHHEICDQKRSNSQETSCLPTYGFIQQSFREPKVPGFIIPCCFFGVFGIMGLNWREPGRPQLAVHLSSRIHRVVLHAMYVVPACSHSRLGEVFFSLVLCPLFPHFPSLEAFNQITALLPQCPSQQTLPLKALDDAYVLGIYCLASIDSESHLILSSRATVANNPGTSIGKINTCYSQLSNVKPNFKEIRLNCSL